MVLGMMRTIRRGRAHLQRGVAASHAWGCSLEQLGSQPRTRRASHTRPSTTPSACTLTTSTPSHHTACCTPRYIPRYIPRYTPYQAVDHAPKLGLLRLLGHRNLILLEHAPATVGAMSCNRRCCRLSGTSTVAVDTMACNVGVMGCSRRCAG